MKPVGAPSTLNIAADDLTELLEPQRSRRDGLELVEVELGLVLVQLWTLVLVCWVRTEQAVRGAGEGTAGMVVQGQEARESVRRSGCSRLLRKKVSRHRSVLFMKASRVLDQTHDRGRRSGRVPGWGWRWQQPTMRLDLQLLGPLVAGQVEQLGVARCRKPVAGLPVMMARSMVVPSVLTNTVVLLRVSRRASDA